VCDHSPISKEAAKPNKILRQTVQAYLKNIERKRAKERAGASSVTDIPATPFTPLISPTPPAPVAEPTLAQTLDAQTPVQSIEQVPEQDVVNDGEFEAKHDVAEPALYTVTTTEQPADADVGDEVQQNHEVGSLASTMSTITNGQIQDSTDADGDEEADSRSRAGSDETEIFTGDEPQKNADGSINRSQYGAENDYAQADSNQLYGGNFDGYKGDANAYAEANWTPEMAQHMQMMQQMPMPNGGWNGQNMMGEHPRRNYWRT
jgi:hypothetical protein